MSETESERQNETRLNISYSFRSKHQPVVYQVTELEEII